LLLYRPLLYLQKLFLC